MQMKCNSHSSFLVCKNSTSTNEKLLIEMTTQLKLNAAK